MLKVFNLLCLLRNNKINIVLVRLGNFPFLPDVSHRADQKVSMGRAGNQPKNQIRKSTMTKISITNQWLNLKLANQRRSRKLLQLTTAITNWQAQNPHGQNMETRSRTKIFQLHRGTQNFNENVQFRKLYWLSLALYSRIDRQGCKPRYHCTQQDMFLQPPPPTYSHHLDFNSRVNTDWFFLSQA